jgi:O-antigen/teichoic acid export membrane protein
MAKINFSNVRKNLSLLLGAEVLIRLMTLVLTIYIARSYGTATFGIFALAIAMGSLFEIISNMGLGTIFLQRVSGHSAAMPKQLGVFLPLRLILSALGLALTIGAAVLLNKNADTFAAIALSGLYFSIFSIVMFLFCCFDARQKMQFTAGVKLFKFSVLFALGMYIVYLGYPVQYVFIAYICAAVVAFVITAALVSRYFAKISLVFGAEARGAWKKIIREGWPITLSGTFVYIYNYLDTIIISVMKGESAVGLYQVSYKIIGTLFILATIINQAYLPKLIETHAGGADNAVRGGAAGGSAAGGSAALSTVFNRALKSIFFWSLPITFGGIILGERIIPFVFGDDYLAGIPTFRILMLNCIIFFLSSAMVNLLYALKKQKSAMKIFFLGALANCVFNIFMIPLFGIEGAAATTVLAETVVLIGIYLLTRKIVRFRVAAGLWRPLLASIGLCAALYFTHFESLLLTIGIGATAYFACYFALSRLGAKSNSARTA